MHPVQVGTLQRYQHSSQFLLQGCLCPPPFNAGALVSPSSLLRASGWTGSSAWLCPEMHLDAAGLLTTTGLQLESALDFSFDPS